MLARKWLLPSKRAFSRIQYRLSSSSSSECCEDPPSYKRLIGDREIVGHGICGLYNYMDRHDFPFPAIRYRECTPELTAMREKERGDWRNLTCEEKKYLYRQSFRITYAEMDAPDSSWKAIIGVVCLWLGFSFWLYIGIHHFVSIEAPSSFSFESRCAQYKRLVECNNNPFTGNKCPQGFEPLVHPKNKQMLEQIKDKQADR